MTEHVTVEDIQTRLRIALRDIAAYWGDMIPEGVEPQLTGTIGRSEQVLEPVRLHALDVRRETTAILNGWARLIMEERDLDGRVNGHDGPALARYIDNHYDWLAAHDAGPDACDEITTCARRVHGVARPRIREDIVFVGPCECGERIHATREEQMIACPTCDRASHRDDLREAALSVVRDTLCTAKQAEHIGTSLAVPVKSATIRQWTRREKLAPLACDIEDKALRYRFRDVEILATRTAV